MDKKGQIVTIVSLKTYIIIFVIAIAVFLIYWFYITGQLSIPTTPNTCSGIVPDRMSENVVSYYVNGNYIQSYWADGQKILGFYSCRQGVSQGQNINYIYCNGLGYQKKVINTDGTIGKEIILKIDVVFDSQNKTTEGYKVISYKCENSEYGWIGE